MFAAFLPAVTGNTNGTCSLTFKAPGTSWMPASFQSFIGSTIGFFILTAIATAAIVITGVLIEVPRQMMQVWRWERFIQVILALILVVSVSGMVAYSGNVLGSTTASYQCPNGGETF